MTLIRSAANYTVSLIGASHLSSWRAQRSYATGRESKGLYPCPSRVYLFISHHSPIANVTSPLCKKLVNYS